jgi:cytochrome c-type biogenesis protein CcmE
MKKTKLIALGGVITSVVVISLFLTINLRPYLSVSQVYEDPLGFEARTIQVIGNVEGYDGDGFYLTENNQSIYIDASQIDIPHDVENGIEVVVEGLFHSVSNLTAHQILTQCS